MTNEPNDFAAAYSDDSFWAKVKKYARVAGASVLEPALKMYYSLLDSDTPAWAKTVIIGALGYFILPVDAIPDFTPVIGYADDVGVLVAALGIVAAHIKPDHVARAQKTMKEWLG